MKILTLIVFLSMLLFFCDSRNGSINPRNNPYDSGSNDFVYDGLPDLSFDGTVEPKWYDFDHQTDQGSIKLSYSVNDPNFPHDTLTCRFFVGDNKIATVKHTDAVDTFVIIPGLSPAETYSCSVLVTDGFDSTIMQKITFTAPVLLPPIAPEPTLSSGSNPITISWVSVPAADAYIIYGAENKDSAFSIDTIINQPSKGANIIVAVSRNLPENGSRFFIVASKNNFGESKSNILYARLFSNAVPVPSIDDVSQGSYPDYISITWRPVNNKITTYDLYRAESVGGPYTILSTINNVTTQGTYRDTVELPNIYFYKLAAIDAQNRSSLLSEAKFGHILNNRLPIDLNAKSETGFVALYWDSIPNVVKYYLYRSTTSCDANMQRIFETASFIYNDAVTSQTNLYYTVVGVNKDNKEIAESKCTSVTSSALPAPFNPEIVNTATSSVITWDKLAGAKSYVVFRSMDNCVAAPPPYDTITTTSFTDTDNIQKNRYYKIAALDNANRLGTMTTCLLGSPFALPAPANFQVSTGVHTGAIALKWDAVSNAVSYAIYRAPNTTCANQTKIATVAKAEFVDSVQTSATYSYSVRGIDKAGTEGVASACKTGSVKQLPAPTNLIGTNNVYTQGVKLTWQGISDPVLGYIVYRGTSISTLSMTAIDTAKTTDYFDTLRNDNKFYYYRVAAYNKFGPGPMSDYTSGRVLVPPTLSIYKEMADVQISWIFSRNAQKAYIYRSTDSSTFNRIDSTSNGYYLDYPNDYTRYYYFVDLKLETGETVRSNIAAGYKLLPAPTNLKLTEYDYSAYLTWDYVAGATSYGVFRSTDGSNGTFLTEVTGTSFNDTGVAAKKRFYYSVTARNTNCESNYSNQVSGSMLQTPAVPYVYTDGNLDAVIIYLQPNSSGSAPTGFQIYRSTSSTGRFMLIDSTSSETYYDNVPDFSTYYYKATAYNNSGTSGFSDVAAGARQLPYAPSYVDASKGLSTKYIRISWSPVELITGYRVYRRNTSTSVYEKIGTTKDTVFFDSAMGEYYNNIGYYVTSYKDSTESSASSYATGSLFGPPSSVSASSALNGVSVSWSSRTNAAQYYIYRSATAEGTFTRIDSSIYNSYVDTNELATNNFYKIAVVSSVNSIVSVQSKASNGAIRSYPNAPTGIAATIATDSTTVRVSWQKVTGATKYQVFRSTADTFTAVNSKLIATVDSSFYADVVPTDSIYFYRLKSVNKGGESSLSTSKGRGYRIPKKVPVSPIELDTLAYSGSVYLTWKMPPQTIAYSGFKVYRAVSDTSAYTFVATISSYTQLYYLDKPPSSYPTTYWYKVSAVNQFGESPLTTSVSGSRQ